MFLINLLFSLSLCLILIIILVIIIGSFYINNINKIMTFECGFLPFILGHFPISLRFFLIILLFLVFDIEILLLIPYIYFINYFQIQSCLYIFILVIFILLFGLYYE